MILHGDCLTVLATLDEASIHACITDPPYELGFMGKQWDRSGVAFQAQTWEAVYRVLKPGAHLLAFGGTRTFHRMTCAIEDAGFEIRDCLSFLYGQGFPKSLNFGCKCRGNAIPYSHASLSTPERDVRPLFDADVPEAIDASDERGEVLLDGMPEQGAPAPREADGTGVDEGREQSSVEGRQLHRAGEGLQDDPNAESSEGAGERLRAGAYCGGRKDSRPTPEAERGSASQGPRSSEQRAGEPANLRLASGTLDGGTPDRRSRCERCGGLTAARGLGTALKPSYEPIVLARKPFKGTVADCFVQHGTAALNIDECRIESEVRPVMVRTDTIVEANAMSGCSTGATGNGEVHDLGRWPSNVLLDEEAARQLDEQTGELPAGIAINRNRPPGIPNQIYGQGWKHSGRDEGYGGSGGASRFFYVAKPSREERDFGTLGLIARQRDESRKEGNPGGDNPRNRGLQPRGNFHPTVKPVELMRWLVRLVTPPNGVVLDPFLGSGTTGMACRYEHRQFIGIEREADYIAIAERRIAAVAPLFAEEHTA